MVRRSLICLVALIGSVLLAPAGQASVVAGVKDTSPVPGASVPVVMSDNIEVLASLPDVGAISTAFDPTRPLMYVNSLTGISVYDISDPELPLLKGDLPMPHFENEAMAVGQRDGVTFVLVGVDIFSVTPTDTNDPVFASGGSARHLIVVDVTDPTMPVIRSQLDTGSSTHTVQCVTLDCHYVYTSGAYQNNKFDVIDLSNLDAPMQVAQPGNIAGKGGGIGGHQWDLDDAGLIWSSGGNGIAAFDVSDPVNPVTVASTDAKGKAGSNPYNNFILHNSYHPNADAFVQTRDEVTQRLVSGSPETASVFDGNVLLATEEDYESPVCEGAQGTFSTWYVPYLEGNQYANDNANLTPGLGKITPLDNWVSEILDTGEETVAGAFCSAHYFTFHDAGFIAQGWYQQGTRILDVRDPRDIKQVGYFFTGDTETWHAYWVPERDANGVVTGNDTNIVYTNDVSRGIDVLRVTLPATPTESTRDLHAPILPQWLAGSVATSAPSEQWGYLCRIPGTFDATPARKLSPTAR